MQPRVQRFVPLLLISGCVAIAACTTSSIVKPADEPAATVSSDMDAAATGEEAVD